MIRNKLKKLSIASSLAFIVTSCCNDDNGNANTPPIATNVTIRGTNTVGQILTVTAVTSDADRDPVTSKYQWYRADNQDGSNETVIDGATMNQYTLVSADAGKYITVKVTPNDGKVDGAEVKADYRGPIATSIGGSDEEASTQITISPSMGAAVVGKTLIAEFQGFSEEEQSRLTYQWYRADDENGANEEAIEPATGSEYETTPEDQDKFIALEVTLPKEGESDAKTAKSSYIEIKENHIPIISEVTISGMAIVGQFLTANTNVTDENEGEEIELSYQWYRVDSDKDDDDKQTETLIPGAFKSEYRLVGADEGKFITVKVTPYDGATSGEEVTANSPVGPIEV